MGVQFAGNILVQANGGPLPISQGGTGQTTAPTAINALLPTQAGNSGKFLTTNGTNVSWSTAGASAGGSDTQIQFNDSGNLNGSANLVINKSTGAVTGLSTFTSIGTNVTGAAATNRPVKFQTAGSDRWIMQANNAAETGSAAGSNFELIRVADNGATTNQVFTIARNSGIVDFKTTPTVNGVAIGGTPAGSNTQIQYNNSGVFGASSSFAWDNSSTTLTVGPQVGATGGTVTIGPPDGSGIGAGTSVLIKATSTSNNFSSNPGSITLQAGSLTGDNGNGSSQGGSINLSAGNSVVSTFNTGSGGNVIISGGLGIAGSTLGYIAFKTGITGSLTERFRILNNGAWSVGSAGTNTGTSGQVLTSTGSTTAPTWQNPSGGVSSVAVSSANGAITVSGSPITSSGTISLTANNFTTSVAGVVPASGGGTTNFLRADGTWAAPAATATSLSGTGTPTLNAPTTKYVAVGVTAGGLPLIQSSNSSAAVDNRMILWQHENSGEYASYLQNDAVSTNTKWFSLTRSGTTASTLTLTANSTNLAGLSTGLQLNGSAGTSGQVLTSQGSAAAPVWSSPSVTALNGTGTPTATVATSGAYIGQSSNQAFVRLVNSTLGTDAKAIGIYNDPTVGSFNLSFINDALLGQTPFMTVTRSGTTANAMTLTATSMNHSGLSGGFQFNGSAGTSGQVLTSNGAAAAPTWQSVSASTATNIAGGATNQIPYQTAASTTAFSSAFTFTPGTNTFAVGTVNTTPTVIQAPDVSTGTTAASSMTLRGGDGGSATVNAGQLILRGGNYTSSANAAGAAVTITGGSHTGTGTAAGAAGGNVTIAGGSGGSSSSGPGGNLVLNGGSASGTGAGGNVTISGGTTVSGTTGGFISFSTTAAAGAVTERLRILANGAWSVGTGGTATGTANAPLISGGSAAVPVWATNMTWDSTARSFALGLNATNGAVVVQSPDLSSTTASAGMTFRAGDVTASTGGGGAVTVRGGNSTGGASGALNLLGGTGGTTGGTVTVTAGNGTTTNGAITMSAGGGGTNAGGAVTISAGSQVGGTGNAGNLTLNAGSVSNSSTGGTGGTVTINAGNAGDGFSGPATAGGSININAGANGQQSAAGGSIAITAGLGSTGGNLTLTAGSAATQGGNLILNAGNGSSTGGPTGGDIYFTSGNGTARIERFRITNNGYWALNGAANVGTNGQYLRSTGTGVSWTTIGTAPSNLTLSSGAYIGNGTLPEMSIVNASAAANNRVWETRVNNSGTFYIAVDDDTFASSTAVFSMTRTGNTVNTIAFTGTAMTQSGTFQATTVNVTGATAPANGMYLSAANTIALSSNTTARLTINANGQAIFTGGLATTKNAPAFSATPTISCNTGNAYAVTMTANITSITFTNVPAAGSVFELSFFLTQGAGGNFTVTWPAAVKWPGGTAPTLTTTAGKTDVFRMVTHDGGATWYANTVGLNY